MSKVALWPDLAHILIQVVVEEEFHRSTLPRRRYAKPQTLSQMPWVDGLSAEIYTLGTWKYPIDYLSLSKLFPCGKGLNGLYSLSEGIFTIPAGHTWLALKNRGFSRATSIYTAAYKIGVSTSATSTLNKYPASRSGKNNFHSMVPVRQSRESTDAVSTSWEARVEKLFLSQRCFPLVTRFQKWKSRISRNCARRYAVKDLPVVEVKEDHRAFLAL